MSKETLSRRDFLRLGALVLVGASTGGCEVFRKQPTPPATLKSVADNGRTVMVAASQESTPTPTLIEKETIPENAVVLEKGEEIIPPWGYGAQGVPGVVYEKVLPGGKISVGTWQLITDFDGSNWGNGGEWSCLVDENVRRLLIVGQGDAPVKVRWSKDNQLKFWSNAEVSASANSSTEGSLPPQTGSTGVSLVVHAEQ